MRSEYDCNELPCRLVKVSGCWYRTVSEVPLGDNYLEYGTVDDDDDDDTAVPPVQTCSMPIPVENATVSSNDAQKLIDGTSKYIISSKMTDLEAPKVEWKLTFAAGLTKFIIGARRRTIDSISRIVDEVEVKNVSLSVDELNVVTSKGAALIDVAGMLSRILEYAHRDPTHFICIPLSSGTMRDGFMRFADDVLSWDNADSQLHIPWWRIALQQ
eukprot:Lankesteria_metandrocarpae@DN2004_c0_g1_i2.p1